MLYEVITIGGMLAPPLVIACIQLYNWETAFVVTGAIGFIWVALWLFFSVCHLNIQKSQPKNVNIFLMSYNFV